MSTDPDALVAAVRSRYGQGPLTFRSEKGLLLVEILDCAGVVRIGSGVTVSRALRNLLEGGCASA